MKHRLYNFIKNGKAHRLALLFLMISSVLNAQKAMSLQECLDIGLRNNFDIRMVRNEERISDNNVTLGNAGYLPTASLNSGYNIRNSNTAQYPADGSDAQRSSGGNTQTLDAGVNLNWSIFEGFSIRTNHKRLKELQSIGQLNTRLAVENIVAGITAEYYNLVQQQIRLNNLKYAVELSKERLRIVEARYQVGAGSRLDLQQAKVDFNADSSQLIQQYEVLNSSRIALNELMGVDVNVLSTVSDSEIELNTLLTYDELYESTLANNTSLLLAGKSVTLSELELKSLQSRNYPYLRLNTGYAFTHYDYSTGAFDKQRNWGPNVGLTLGYTLFDGFNRSREQRNARVTIENRELAVGKKELQLQSDFANMWMAYQNNIELKSLEKESLENARLNYEIAMERYKIGDISGIQLREAQNSLLGAEQRLLNAEYRTKLYEISLLQISGQVESYLD